ncbi:MAG: response regulator [Polyangiaceae bacterium]|nr:response regulator [Polyangiaceae bacterium]
MSASVPRSTSTGHLPAPPRERVRTALLGMLACSLILSGVGALAGAGATLVLSVIGAAGATVALLLLRAGLTLVASVLGLVVPLALSALAMWVGDSLRDTAIMILPVVILLGCFVLERPYTTVVIGVTIAVPIVMGVAESSGWIPLNLPPLDPADYFVAPVLLGGLGVVAELSAIALARSERSYREIFNATQEAICIHDADTGAIVDVNDRMLAIYHCRREEIPPLGFGDLTAISRTHHPARALELLRQAVTKGPQFFEWRAERKDRTQFWVEVTLRRTVIGGSSRVLAVVRDIDDRKRSAEQALQSEKLRSLGLLAGGVAHDFNNQLAVIGGLAQLLALRAHDPAQIAEHAGQIIEATRRAAALTGKLLAFARKGSTRDEPIDLNVLVADTAELLRRSVARQVDVRVTPCEERLVAVGDAAQIANALLNLGINARDAMPNGGVLTFRTETVNLDQDDATALELSPGPYALVAVADSGEGMSDEVRERAIEPFFTTKAEGTGMGLAQVYGAARAHHGAVRITSRLGVGSEVTVYLPIADTSSPPSSPGVAPTDANLGLRVLVAEDEEQLAATMCLLLEQLGCTAESHHDGQSAVEAFARRPGNFDVVLLDLAMPRMTGASALAELRRIDPEVRVVLTSGFATAADIERLQAAGAAAYLPKPATVRGLVRALRRAVAKDSQHEPSTSG